VRPSRFSYDPLTSEGRPTPIEVVHARRSSEERAMCASPKGNERSEPIREEAEPAFTETLGQVRVLAIQRGPDHRDLGNDYQLEVRDARNE
jgi:hypothetical protein